MNDSLLLLKNFIKNPKEIGAVVPSSKFLKREIIRNIDFAASRNIVELGPGTGIFTKAILKKSKRDSKLICLEVNKKFCGYLSKSIKDKRLAVINAPAEELESNLLQRQIQKVDCIVSGLPFRNFSEKKKRSILKQVNNSLSPGGKFILFQYTNGLLSLLESHFSKVERKFVALNVPPSFVYICEK